MNYVKGYPTAQPADPVAAGEFDVFYRRHFDAVYRYVGRALGGDGSDINDLVSEVFTVAWRRLASIPSPPNDLLWLFGVSRNVVLHNRRTRARRRRLVNRLKETAGPPSRSDDEPELAQLQARLDRLSARDREVLHLIYWEDLTVQDAASVIGCSPNAVTLRLRRIRRQLEKGAESQ